MKMKIWTKLAVAGGLLAAMSLLPSAASAQTTSSGTLAVTASVQPSISMVFDQASGGIAITGGGSNSATLAFGGVSAYDAEPANVTGSNDPANSKFTVTADVAVNVSEANSASASYKLTAELGTADSTNVWAVDGVTMSSTTANPVGTQADSYGGDVSHSVSITVPYSVNGASASISNSIDFVATAN
jgi:hypothetical protein